MALLGDGAGVTLLNPSKEIHVASEASMAEINFIQIFILIGAAQGILLGIVSLKKGGNNAANTLLALVFLILSFRLGVYPFKDISDSEIWTFIYDFSLLSLLLIGPFLYLFIASKLFNRRVLRVLELLHLVPFLVYTVHLVFPIFYLPVCYSYATLLSGGIYGAVSLFIVSASDPRVKRTGVLPISDCTRLYSFALPLLIIPVLIWILVSYSRAYFGFHPATIPYLGLTFGLYRLAFKSTLNSRYFFRTFLDFEQKAKMTIDQSRLAKLVALVEEQELFLDQGLSMQKLCLETGFSRHEIGELLKQALNKNYNQFINDYRVEASKMKLIDAQYKHLSIEGIAIESGFRSKSSFNQIFKTNTGLTPTEYRKANL